MINEKFYEIIDGEIDKLIKIFKKNDHLKKQNEKGQKSFAFLLWFLEKYLPNSDLSEFENLITEGNDDSSSDLIFANTDQVGNEVYYVVQAKWFVKQNINNSKGISKEIKACLSDFSLILSGKKELSDVNDNFNRQYQKFLTHKKNNGKVKFVFLALCKGDIDIAEHINHFISSLVSFDLIDFFKLKKQYIEIEYKGIKTHNPLETPYIPQVEFELQIKKNQVIYINSPYQSNIFLVKPKAIYELFEKYGHSLFYKNIRNPLPNSYFNKEITNTVKNNPLNFWYFNNGITAITEKIFDFYGDTDKVKLRGIQIINGAQTVFSIYEAYKYSNDEERNKMDEDALISLRVLKSGGEDFDLKVTRYTNSQNPISERDFHSNDDVQKRLQSDFFNYTNVWYETRRGEFRKRVKGITKLTNEKIGQTYLAYFINDPFSAKQSRKLLFSSKNIYSNGLYEFIFNDDTKYDDMLVSYYLYLLIDRKRKWYKARIDKIDTSKDLSKEEIELLNYDFIQYANFEILALFKIFLFKVNSHNLKSINGKIISFYEKDTFEIVEKNYDCIADFLKKDLKERKRLNSKIVNSVLFKSKDYYTSIKADFEKEIETISLSEYQL